MREYEIAARDLRALIVALLWLWGRDNERALQTCEATYSRATCLNLISR